MPRSFDDIAGTIRETIPEARDRAREAARDLADRGRIAGLSIRRRLRRAERAGRDNAYVMAIAALGIGLLVGWLIGRERD